MCYINSLILGIILSTSLTRFILSRVSTPSATTTTNNNNYNSMCMYIYPTPSPRAGYDTSLIFIISWNLVFPFQH